MVLLARESAVLRGRFVADIALEFAALGVRLDLPPLGTLASAIFAGAGPLDADGRFAIRAPTALPTDEMLVLHAAHGGNVACTPVATAALLSAEGAVIRLELGQLEVRVADTVGAPLAGADVRVSSSALADAALPAIATTDEKGRVRLPVAQSALELVVAKPGYAFARRDVDASAGGERVERFELAPLAQGVGIGGRVLADGRPVEGALVTAFADARSVETALRSGTWMPDGRRAPGSAPRPARQPHPGHRARRRPASGPDLARAGLGGHRHHGSACQFRGAG
jgi:hypothetical protein